MFLNCLPSNGQNVLMALMNVISKYDFILAGGTSLALQIRHRMSVDLDFFATSDFKTDILFHELQHLTPVVIKEERGTLLLVIDGVKVSFILYPYPFIDSPVDFDGVKLAGILDIASMKVMAISQRGAKRDFIDLYFILDNVPYHKIADNLVYRYGKNRINPIDIGKSLVFFNDAESDPDPAYLSNNQPQWKSVKKFFVSNVKPLVLTMQQSIDNLSPQSK